MADIDLHKEYNSSGESVQDLFDSTEEGFFVPLYQREYTWEEDNINQLFDDLVLGTRELSDSDSATTFLGTTILTPLGDRKLSVKPGDTRAQPTAVQIVIDGQQRISTLALLSIQITEKLKGLLNALPHKPPYSDLRNAGNEYIKRLKRLHTIELGKGATPPFKPKIIRAREDRWTYAGSNCSYASPIARYIATFISAKSVVDAGEALDRDSGARVLSNVRLIDEWLDAVCDAHVSGSKLHEQFPVGRAIATERMQEYVLDFSDDGVGSVVELCETDKVENNYSAAATFQLLLLVHYLLRRCGVNRLQPTREEWGFDMFQALNATGTPLTVIETFVPQVMQAELAVGKDWDSAPSKEFMDDIQDLFDATATNEQKNRRTNELLGAFALCYEGKKLGNKFSEQRRWLNWVYEKDLPAIGEKREFLTKLAGVAHFYYFGWYLEESNTPNIVSALENEEEGELASLLIRYLRDAGSRLSAPVLSRVYSQVREQSSNAGELVQCAKVCAAFFTLWRSANSTSGLDEIYRKYFRGSKAPIEIVGHSWKELSNPISVKDLKEYFLEVLQAGGIAEREAWIAASERFLLYSELKTICRFVLFLASHDRVPDEERPGRTSPGISGSCKLMTLERWLAKDHKSIEHVAPQNPPQGSGWDGAIYKKELVHHLGNLVLLPMDLNKFADNKEWAIKYLYYCHVGQRNKDKLEALNDAVKRRGVTLSRKAVNALKKMEYNCAIEPVVRIGEGGRWDSDIIQSRTRQIKEVAWEVLISWLRG